MLRLRIIDNHSEKELEFDQQKILIGRSPNSEVQIDDLRVSRFHAVIELLSDSYYIRDLGTINGTTLNGEQIESSNITTKDLLVIGPTTIIVLNAPPIEERLTKKTAKISQNLTISIGQKELKASSKKYLYENMFTVFFIIALSSTTLYFVDKIRTSLHTPKAAKSSEYSVELHEHTTKVAEELLNQIKEDSMDEPLSIKHYKQCQNLSEQYSYLYQKLNKPDPIAELLGNIYSTICIQDKAKSDYFNNKVNNLLMENKFSEALKVATYAASKLSEFTKSEGAKLIKLVNSHMSRSFSELEDKLAIYAKIDPDNIPLLIRNEMQKFKDTEFEIKILKIAESNHKYSVDDQSKDIRSIENELFLIIEILRAKTPQIESLREAMSKLSTILSNNKVIFEKRPDLIKTIKNLIAGLIEKSLDGLSDLTKNTTSLESTRKELDRIRNNINSIVTSSNYAITNANYKMLQSTLLDEIKKLNDIWDGKHDFVNNIHQASYEVLTLFRPNNHLIELELLNRMNHALAQYDAFTKSSIRTYAKDTMENSLIEQNKLISEKNVETTQLFPSDLNYIIQLVNTYREQMGLRILEINRKIMDKVSEAGKLNIASVNKNIQTILSGEFKKSNIPQTIASVNLSRGSDIPIEIFIAWLASPEYHRNILSLNPTTVGASLHDKTCILVLCKQNPK